MRRDILQLSEGCSVLFHTTFDIPPHYWMKSLQLTVDPLTLRQYYWWHPSMLLQNTLFYISKRYLSTLLMISLHISEDKPSTSLHSLYISSRYPSMLLMTSLHIMDSLHISEHPQHCWKISFHVTDDIPPHSSHSPSILLQSLHMTVLQDIPPPCCAHSTFLQAIPPHNCKISLYGTDDIPTH